MRDHQRKLFFLTASALILLFAIATTRVAQAQDQGGFTFEVPLPSLGGVTPGESPASYVRYLFLFGLGLGGILAFAMIVVGGIQYAISAGNASKISDAQGRIRDAILGLLLLLGSYLILKTINPSLVSLRNLSLIPAPAPSPSSEQWSCKLSSTGMCSAVYASEDECKNSSCPQVGECIKKSDCPTAEGPKCPVGGTTNPVLFSAYPITLNSTMHGQPGSGHGWAACGDSRCAVDYRPGKTCSEALTNARTGVPVYAPFDGVVVTKSNLYEFGQGIRITENGKDCTNSRFCALLAHIAASVNIGQRVKKGDEVGRLASWSCGPGVFGPHLHFEVKMAGKWVWGDKCPSSTSNGACIKSIAEQQQNTLVACY